MTTLKENTTEQFLLELYHLGLDIELKNDKLVCNGNLKLLTESDIEQLKTRKPEIISQLTDADKKLTLSPNGSKRRELLTSSQHSLWYLYKTASSNTTYNIPVAFEFEQKLCKETLYKAVSHVVKRNVLLRAIFNEDDDGPYQQVIDVNRPNFEVHKEISDINAFLLNIINKPFELEIKPAYRVDYIESGSTNILLINMHHIISDGWSTTIFIREIRQAFNDIQQCRATNTEAKNIDYLDYVTAQFRWLKHPQTKLQIERVQEYLKNSPELLALPKDNERPEVMTNNGATHELLLSNLVKTEIEGFCQKLSMTPFIAYLVAFQAVLHRLSGQDDVCIGVPSANRVNSELESILGYFVNTNIYRSIVREKTSLREAIIKLKQDSLFILENQNVPLDCLLDPLMSNRSLSYSPLFQVMFSYQNFPSVELVLSGQKATQYTLPLNTAKFDISLTVVPAGGKVKCIFEYNKDIYNAETIRQLSNYYQHLLGTIQQQFEVPISELTLSYDQPSLMPKVQDSSCNNNWHVIQRLLEISEQFPDAIAIEENGHQISYKQLVKKILSFANLIRKEHGLNSGSRIGVHFDRSHEMVIAILAILYSQNIYVPLDKNYPQSRLQFMANDANLSAVVCQDHSTSAEIFTGIPCIEYQDTYSDVSVFESSYNDSGLAYIIYTSGSTGNPKGVMISHQALANHMSWMMKEFNFVADDRILLKTAISFDASVWELYGPLLSGATLVLANKESHRDINALAEEINKKMITVVQLVPSVLPLFIDASEQDYPNELRLLFCGGEVLTSSACISVAKHLPEVQLVNLYGPTEATIDTTFWRVNMNHPESLVFIGKPINNVDTHVLGVNHQQVPFGVIGELCISGVGLANGYYGKEQLTKERFVMIDGVKLYKTGDLVRKHRSGNLEYIGRADNQVKINGCRMELEEIESATRAIHEVEDCLVFVNKSIANPRLEALIVSNDFDNPVIRNSLLDQLPEFMIPAQLHHCEELPRLPNGKLDRNEAAKLYSTVKNVELYESAKTATEQLICDVYSTVLEVEKVGRDSNFFELGGNSLSIAKVLSKIKAETGVSLSFTDVFKYPCAKDLAAVLGQQSTSIEEVLMPLEPYDSLPLSPQQVRYFQTYNIDLGPSSRMTLIFGKWQSETVFEQTIQYMINRYELFRTSFCYFDDSEICQKIHPNYKPKIVKVSIDSQEEMCLKRAFDKHFRENPFNLLELPLIKVAITDIGDGKIMSAICIFNGILDAYSGGVFEREFEETYKIIESNGLSENSSPSLQYQDFCRWQFKVSDSHKFEESQEYWLTEFKEDFQPLYLPKLHTDTEVDGKMLVFLLGEELSKLANQKATESGTSLFIYLLANIMQAATKLYERDDITVGMLYHGRENEDLEDEIGYFVDLLCIKANLDLEYEFLSNVRNVSEKVFKAIDNRSFQYHQLAEHFGGKLTDHCFPITGLHVNNVIVPGEIKQIDSDFNSTEFNLAYKCKFDLNIYLHESNRGVFVRMAYSTSVLNSKSSKEFADLIIKTVTKNCNIKEENTSEK